MSKVSFTSFALNILLYTLISIPILIMSQKKGIYKSKKNYILSICLGTILEIILSLIIYNFPYQIFGLFVSTQGIVNYSVFISRIIFSTSSLISLKFLVPSLLIHLHKKAGNYMMIQIIIMVVFCAIGFLLKKTVGFLFGFPIADLVIFIMNLYTIRKIFKKK